jgi:hypothetical protein
MEHRMRPTRLAAVVLASSGLALLGAGGTAYADTTSSTPTTVAGGGTATPPTSASPTGDSTVLTPDAAGAYTVTLPGVGTLTFQVDPTTGTVSNVVATVAPDAPTTVVAGTPKLTHDGVSVSFTDTATGVVKVIRAEVETEHGATVVKVENDDAEQGGEEVVVHGWGSLSFVRSFVRYGRRGLLIPAPPNTPRSTSWQARFA